MEEMIRRKCCGNGADGALRSCLEHAIKIADAILAQVVCQSSKASQRPAWSRSSPYEALCNQAQPGECARAFFYGEITLRPPSPFLAAHFTDTTCRIGRSSVAPRAEQIMTLLSFPSSLFCRSGAAACLDAEQSSPPKNSRGAAPEYSVGLPEADRP
ncbi:hypothetical protein VTO73DRAFT_3838 [Trametes versicolor]